MDMYVLGILGLVIAFGGLIWIKIDERRARRKQSSNHQI